MRRAVCFFVMVAGAPAAAAPVVVTAGPPVVLMSNEQRGLLGIRFGPDAPIDVFQAKDGRTYLNTAGALGAVGGPHHQAAWNLHVDSGLTRILALHGDGPATGPADVQEILTDFAGSCGAGRHRLTAADAGDAACAQSFDRDYAGGGSYFRCPDNATSVYFYHGENHTAPDGTAGEGGWFGDGVGVFNADETTVTRARELALPAGGSSAEIIGMNLPTAWGDAPPQAHPFNGVPSAIAGSDGYLYVYSGNATENPTYNPSACRPECMSVSRAPIAAFCAGVKTASPVAWHNYNQGAWTSPAVRDAHAALGFGSGGPFTPVSGAAVPGEHGGTVTYLPARQLFVMVRLVRGGIDVRTSADGLAFSDPRPLVDAPAGVTPGGEPEIAIYPRISVLHARSSHEAYVLTYMVVTKGHFWKWAALMRQDLMIR
jgi:hypothetical protein